MRAPNLPLKSRIHTVRDSERAPAADSREYRRFWSFIGAGWLGTTLGYETYLIPLDFLLKDELHCSTTALSLFSFVGRFTNYIKPLAGIFTDAVPLFGTRRRHYLLFSLGACALAWIVFGVVPRDYNVMLVTYDVLYVTVVFTSTTLGGVMAEAGQRFRATGRLSAQRIAIFRIAAVGGGFLGGQLAGQPWLWTVSVVAALHLVLIPFVYRELIEGPPRPGDVVVETPEGVQVFRDGRLLRPQQSSLPLAETVSEMRKQFGALFRSSTLWRAAGLVVLIMAAPGFKTPLFYYQTDQLHFSRQFVGTLKMVEGAGGILGALLFARLCVRFSLRPLLAMGILCHCGAALLYLGYTSHATALGITALYWCGQTMAVLPLYDLAMRATPKGLEAMGYAVMMSVWNLTFQLSDVVGSVLFKPLGFTTLILINAATTALVLFFIPMLPKALTESRDA